jgi:hypothetical protein
LEAERLSTLTLLLWIVISLPAIAVPLAVPSDVGWTPLAEMESRMFSTDCSVRAVQPYHALRKQSVETLAGFQSSKKPAGNTASELHPDQLESKSVPLDKSNVLGKETSELQLSQQEVKSVPLDRSNVLGKETSELQ